MGDYKRWIKLASLMFAVICIAFLTGCATSSQIAELQMKVDQALQETQHAMDMAKETESKCVDLKSNAAEEFRGAGAAANRAEKAAMNAASSEKSAMESAKSAEEAAAKIQKMYDRMMAK